MTILYQFPFQFHQKKKKRKRRATKNYEEKNIDRENKKKELLY